VKQAPTTTQRPVSDRRQREPEFFFHYRRIKRNGETAQIAFGRPFAFFLIVIALLIAAAHTGIDAFKLVTPLVRFISP
jgi:hypothetical protein